MKITGDKLQFFQSLYEKAKMAASTRNELIDEWERQYRGIFRLAISGEKKF